MTAVGLSVSCLTAQAAVNGWNQDETGWYYQFQDGSYAQKVWMKAKGVQYAFDERGYMITGWCKLDGIWYYFEPSGAMYTGWLQDASGLWYYLTDTGAMQTGWFQDADGSWYYLTDTGAMHTGWLQDADGLWYYLDRTGAMAVSCWIGSYYVNSSGVWVEESQIQSDLGAKLSDAVERMKQKYPEGAYWNHMGLSGMEDYSSVVTDIPCDHEANQLSFCNSYILGNVRGYQCDGFARKLSDEIFGRTALVTAYEYEYDKIKVGDYLRYSTTKDSYISNGHSVIVIGKMGDKLITGEANYGGSCMIHWGGELTREFLDSVYAECFTRY